MFFASNLEADSETRRNILTGLLGLLSTVVGFYFGSRTAESATQIAQQGRAARTEEGQDSAAATTRGPVGVSPAPVTFGRVRKGRTSSRTIRITNTGTEDLRLSAANEAPPGIVLDGDPVFDLEQEGQAMGRTLEPGDSVSFKVVFAPQARTSYRARLTITTDMASRTIGVRGTGVVVP